MNSYSRRSVEANQSVGLNHIVFKYVSPNGCSGDQYPKRRNILLNFDVINLKNRKIAFHQKQLLNLKNKTINQNTNIELVLLEINKLKNSQIIACCNKNNELGFVVVHDDIIKKILKKNCQFAKIICFQYNISQLNHIKNQYVVWSLLQELVE